MQREHIREVAQTRLREPRTHELQIELNARPECDVRYQPIERSGWPEGEFAAGDSGDVAADRAACGPAAEEAQASDPR